MKPRQLLPLWTPNLVVVLARLLDQPKQFDAWVKLATEIDMFGDTLPIEWQRCFNPRSMARVLENTALVGSVSYHSLCRVSSANPDMHFGTMTVTSPTLVLHIELTNGQGVDIELDEDALVLACDAIRRVVPSVSWSDLKP